MSFRACVFEQVGGFDRRYTGTALLEEADLAFRATAAGWTLVFEPRAELLHLSASAGGVRIGDAQRTEWFRFRSTAYYIAKNRGRLGLVPFVATFGMIAGLRAVRWRSLGALSTLARAAREGIDAARCGPDDSIARRVGADRVPPRLTVPAVAAAQGNPSARAPDAARDPGPLEPPTVTVIIPTRNRPQHVLDTVACVLEQSFRSFELLLIDQSDRPVAQELQARIALLGDPRVRYLHLCVPGVANARNEGIVRRRGRIVLFLDDDVILLGKDFITSHLQGFADPRVGGVTGRIVERLNRPNVRRTTARVSIGGRTLDNMFGTEAVPVHGLKGGNMSLRTEVFDQVGGFDRNFGGTGLLEEADFSTRALAAGWKLMFEPRAELLHLSAEVGGNRVGSDLEREWWRFRATAYYIRKHRGILGLPPFWFTFTLIGLRYAWRRRAPTALAHLASGVKAGFLAYRDGPDELLHHCPAGEVSVHEQVGCLEA